MENTITCRLHDDFSNWKDMCKIVIRAYIIKIIKNATLKTKYISALLSIYSTFQNLDKKSAITDSELSWSPPIPIDSHPTLRAMAIKRRNRRDVRQCGREYILMRWHKYVGDEEAEFSNRVRFFFPPADQRSPRYRA